MLRIRKSQCTCADSSLALLFMCAACRTVQIARCWADLPHAAISTSLTGNRSSYWNLKPTLQPPRVRPYSIAPVQKKWYSTGPCANRSSQPRAHEEEGSTVLLLSKRFSTSAAIRLLPRNIHAHSGGGWKDCWISEDKKMNCKYKPSSLLWVSICDITPHVWCNSGKVLGTSCESSTTIHLLAVLHVLR